jgi:drug/metabolite transporter (DMT)-like permease
MNWILIAIGIAAVLVVSKFIHFRHIKHRITAIVLILLALFIYASFSAVIKSNSIDLKTASGVMSAGKIYFSWLLQAFDNVKVLTANAIKMDWVPKNVSLSG